MGGVEGIWFEVLDQCAVVEHVAGCLVEIHPGRGVRDVLDKAGVVGGCAVRADRLIQADLGAVVENVSAVRKVIPVRIVDCKIEKSS